MGELSEKNIEESLVDYAVDEAIDTANCLFKFRQKHASCEGCMVREFCGYLAVYLAKLEAKN